jgi:hypothetical protein
MLKHASWAHGNAVVTELPSGLLVRHWGGGTELQFTFAANQNPPAAWCHIPIPTPVIVNDVRLKVRTLFLLFRTGQHAAIDSVHIFDGPNRIHTEDFVNGSGSLAGRRTGNHANGISAANTIQLRADHEVRWGMSIAFKLTPVALTLSSPPVDPEGTVLITAAGADFF